MMKLSLLTMLAYLAVVLADLRIPQRGMIHHIKKGVAGPNPYIFLTAPKGRSQTLIHAFEVLEENGNKNMKSSDDEDFDSDQEADNDDEEVAENINDHYDADDDDDSEQQLDGDEEEETKEQFNNLAEEKADDDDGKSNEDFDNVMRLNLKLKNSNPQIKNAKVTPMMVPSEHAGAIMVPEEIYEIEGQSVVDEKTGKIALLLSRAVLDSLPDGSVVALMERPLHDESEERANRVIVRRRRKGARRNIKQRRGDNQSFRPVRRGGNKCSKTNRRYSGRVVRRGTRFNGNKRHVSRRDVYLQG